MAMALTIRPLEAYDDRSAFISGNLDLNRFLDRRSFPWALAPAGAATPPSNCERG